MNSAAALAAVADTASDPLDEVIVTGTRESGHKASDSSTPIKVISGESLQSIGQTDLRDALEQLSPSIARESFNTNSAALTDILTLHGLSPNHLLVLVDGKRRHSTASVDTDGPQQGQTGVDIDTIPISAIDHIEILRDGDSAQYGADAIAGVINIILKSSDHGGSVQATAGEYYALRQHFTQTLAGGVDEINYNSLTVAEIRRQWMTARQQAGPRYIITPGCAVPKTSTPQALARLRQSLST